MNFGRHGKPWTGDDADVVLHELNNLWPADDKKIDKFGPAQWSKRALELATNIHSAVVAKYPGPAPAGHERSIGAIKLFLAPLVEKSKDRDINNLQQIKASLRRSLQDLRRELLSKDREVSAKDRQIAQLNQNIAHLTQVNQGLTTDNTRLTSENGRLTTANTRLTTRHANLTTENGRLTIANTRLTTENANFTTENGRLTTANTRLTTENANFTTENVRLTTANTRLTTENANFTTENGRLTTVNTRLTTENDRLTKTSVGLKVMIDKQAAEFKEAAIKAEESYKAEIKEKEDKAVQCQKKYESLENGNTQLFTNLEEMFVKANAQMEQQHQEQQQKMGSLITFLNSLKRKTLGDKENGDLIITTPPPAKRPREHSCTPEPREMPSSSATQ